MWKGDGLMPDPQIKPDSLATRLRRPRWQFSLFALLVFVCFAGGIIGIVGRPVVEGWAKQSEFAALQGVWHLEGNEDTQLLVYGYGFDVISDRFAECYGQFAFYPEESPKRIWGVAQACGEKYDTTWTYSLDEGELELRPVRIDPPFEQERLGIERDTILVFKRVSDTVPLGLMPPKRTIPSTPLGPRLAW